MYPSLCEVTGVIDPASFEDQLSDLPLKRMLAASSIDNYFRSIGSSPYYLVQWQSCDLIVLNELVASQQMTLLQRGRLVTCFLNYFAIHVAADALVLYDPEQKQQTNKSFSPPGPPESKLVAWFSGEPDAQKRAYCVCWMLVQLNVHPKMLHSLLFNGSGGSTSHKSCLEYLSACIGAAFKQKKCTKDDKYIQECLQVLHAASFVFCRYMQWADKLAVGTRVDMLDSDDIWCSAQITAICDKFMSIRCVYWSELDDEAIPADQWEKRLACPGSRAVDGQRAMLSAANWNALRYRGLDTTEELSSADPNRKILANWELVLQDYKED